MTFTLQLASRSESTITANKRGAGRAICALLPLGLLLTSCAEMADHGVAVSSSANPQYTRSKYGPVTKAETYVVMPGNYLPGLRVDRSLQKLPFRQMVESLAPELARRKYLPAKNVGAADLILVVHWGVTSPEEKMDRMLARDPPSLAEMSGRDANTGVDYHPHTVDPTEVSMVQDENVAAVFAGFTSSEAMDVAYHEAELRTDEMGAEYSRGNAIALLGYGRHLSRSEDHPFATAEEATLRSDLESERYFVVIQAYNLHKLSGKKPKLVWTLHLNMRSAGNAFGEAVVMMGSVAVNYFGRNLDRVETDLPHVKQGTVTIGEITILGETR